MKSIFHRPLWDSPVDLISEGILITKTDCLKMNGQKSMSLFCGKGLKNLICSFVPGASQTLQYTDVMSYLYHELFSKS